MTQIPLVLVKKMLMLVDNYLITNFKWNFKDNCITEFITVINNLSRSVLIAVTGKGSKSLSPTNHFQKLFLVLRK